MVYGGGRFTGTTEFWKGKGTPGSALAYRLVARGIAPVRKLSCHRLGTMLVIAPPACNTV